MRANKSTGIKKKIAAGFIILLLFAFIGIYSVIRLAVQLYPSESGVSGSVSKLALTSNLLSSIIGSDGQARAFINTGNSEYLKHFNDQEKITKALIDSLKLTSVDNTNQYLRALTVDSLLELKRNTLEEFFNLRNKSVPTKSVDLVEVIKDYRDTIRIPSQTISKTVTEQLSPVKEKKKGFLPRLWQGITGKNKKDSLTTPENSTIVKFDTITTFQTYRDTTISRVKTQLRRIEARESKTRQFIIDRELKLIQADQDIMNEIRAILLLFEKEEIANTIASTTKGQEVLDKLWLTALILAALGLITTVGFIILIWKDLAKSAFYRRQLEEARSFAESLLKVKEQFLANMSHEIRTPLTSIIGFTERLTETSINHEQSKYLKYINSSSEHLLELINDLLDFSRIESGKLLLENKTFNPSDLIEEAFNTLSSKAKAKGLDITLSMALPEDINLQGDPLRLRQIIINLLSNSIKFTEAGKVLLQSKGHYESDGQSYELIIRIADTGIGIPIEKQKMIFEEFSQVDPGITRKYGGSGLGLAISKKLIDSMGGYISVISQPERGTIFTIRVTLPVSPITFVEETHFSYNPVSVNLKGISILLAEDDFSTRILIRDLLCKYNAKVTEANDGREAWEIFRAEPTTFDLLITDIQMPGLSGPELINKIKSLCRDEDMRLPPIIGLTAHANYKDIEEYIALGMDEVILKPFRKEELIRILNKTSIRTTESHLHEGSGENKMLMAEIKPSVNMSYPQTVDLSGFRQFAGDDEDSLNRIIDSLIVNLDTTKESLKEAFSENNYTELSLLAHRIQPNIRLLGASKVSDLLKKLELTSRNEPDEKEKIKLLFNESISNLTQLKIDLEKAQKATK